MATISTNDIKIRYDIDLSKLQQATSEFDKITAEERKLLNELGKLKKQFDDAGEAAKKSNKKAADSFSGVKDALSDIGQKVAAAFAVSKIIDFTKTVINTTIQFESLRKAINFTSGSVEAGAANFQFLRDVSNRLGISLEAAASGFKAISAATAQAGYSNLQTQKIFENVSKAVAAFGLSSDGAAGVFKALSDIISKGTVQAEELRGQIGDRIPGAFSIAAKAIGVSERELNKLMATGKVTAAEFVIPFTDALGKMSEQASTLDSMGKGLQRFQNAWSKLLESLGRQIDENVGIGKLVNVLTRSLDYLGTAASTSIQRYEQAMAQGYQRMMESEIATYDKTQKEKIKIVVETQLQTTQVELKNARKKQTLQEAEIKNLKGFHPFQRRAMRDNLELLNKEVEKLELKEAKLKGNLKAFDEMLKQNNKLKEIISDPKADNDEYQRKLKLLQIERQLATIQNQIRFGNKIDLIREEYKAEDKFQKDVYNLQVEYSKKGVQAATDGIETTAATRKLNKVETIRDLKKETEETLNEIKKQKEANAKFDQERGKAQDERALKRDKTNKDIEKLEEDHQKAMDDLDKKFAKEREERRQKELKEREDNIIAATQLGQTLFEGYTQLHNASIDRQLSALEKRYSKEIEYAQGNQQKIDQLTQEKAQKEKELKTKAWKAERDAAVARVVFETASIVAKWFSNPVTTPLAVLTLANQAAQIGFIMAQRVPEFAEGTKGKPFKGGAAIVGEKGVEKVVTKSGKVYFTPNKASLVDLPKGSEVVPHHQLTKQELFLSGHYANKSSSGSPVVGKLDELGSILKGLPLTQVSMDERGFEKFIRTPRRTTKILNNRFRSNHD